MYFNRFDVCEAYALYDMLWGPTPYGCRLYNLGYRSRILLDLDTANENVKAIYGGFVRRHNRLYIAYSRYSRRNSHAQKWPGTNNMKTGAYGWLRERGLLEAMEMYV